MTSEGWLHAVLRTWRGLIGAGLAFSALGFATADLISSEGKGCGAQRSVSLDLTPIFLVMLAATAFLFSVKAVRKGEFVLGALGLAAVSVTALASILGTATGTFWTSCG